MKSTKKKKISRKERELKSNAERSKRVTLDNEIDMRILLLLYLHKCLTAEQIHRLLPGPIIDPKDAQLAKLDIESTEPLRDIKLNSLINKLRHMKNRGVIKRISKLDALGHEIFKIHHFVITDLGISILLEFFNIPKEKGSDEKFHFSNFKMNSITQKDHHFSIQDWISRLTMELSRIGIHLPGCEWRRYFNGDPNEGGNAAYRPDWMFFKPNDYYDYLSGYGTDLHKQMVNPFIYPLKTRDSYLKMLSENSDFDIDWKSSYQPFIYFEMDMGSMDHKLLSTKFANIRENVVSTVDVLVFVSNQNRLDVEEGESSSRARNVRKTLLKQFKRDSTLDKLHVIHGNQMETIQAVKDYICNSYSFLNGLDIADINSFQVLVESHNKSTGSNAKIYPTHSSEAIQIFPYIKQFDGGLPDYVIIQDRFLDNDRSGKPIGKTVDFIYVTRKYWFNPQAKAILYQEWVSKGKWNNHEVRVVLMYPTKFEMENDVFTQENVTYEVEGTEENRGLVCSHLRFSNFETIREAGSLDNLYKRVKTKNSKGIQWEEVKLYERSY